MFEMHNVTKAYRTDLLETHALREFSLKVDNDLSSPGRRRVKTTFLNVAGLLETFDSAPIGSTAWTRGLTTTPARQQPQDRVHLPEL
jgi:hypothetical protein